MANDDAEDPRIETDRNELCASGILHSPPRVIRVQRD
jgi:hypothetical protein